MATNKKNLRQQLKRELYRQYENGKGKSRHDEKERLRKLENRQNSDRKKRGLKPLKSTSHAHLDRIYSSNSLKTHLTQINDFSKWVKEQEQPVKKISDITKEVVANYLQEKEKEGNSAHTISAKLLALNHVLNGSGQITESYKKTDFGLQKRLAANIY